MLTASPVRVVTAAVVAVALFTFGCASAPEAEKKAAEEAVSAAKAAGAERYAAGEFAAATDSLRQAESHLGAKRYNEAKTAYTKARDLAEGAVKAAEARKAGMRSEVEQRLATMEARWQELEAKVKATAKKLKLEQKQTWEADAKGVEAAFQSAKGGAANDPNAANEKLVTIGAIVEKWEAELKPQASPSKPARKR